jgi:hypothetical protein
LSGVKQKREGKEKGAGNICYSFKEISAPLHTFWASSWSLFSQFQGPRNKPGARKKKDKGYGWSLEGEKN